MALVENAGHGSDVAAPLAGQILRTYMTKKLGLPEEIKIVTPEKKVLIDSTGVKK